MLKGKINDSGKEILTNHINQCDKCSEEFYEIKEIHDVLNNMFTVSKPPDESFRSKVMKEIEECDEITKRRKLNMYKRKIVAAVICFCIIGGSFIPVNGQTVANTIKEWVSSITVKTDDSTIIGEDKDIEISEQKYEELKEDAKSFELNEQPMEVMKKDMGILYVNPKNVPDRYTFAGGVTNQLVKEAKHTFDIYELYYKTNMDKEYAGQDFITVSIEIQTDAEGYNGESGSRSITAPGATFKDVSLLGKEAMLFKLGACRELITGDYYVGDHVLMSLQISMKNNYTSDDDCIEELIKIAESIVTQYSEKEKEIIEYYENSYIMKSN